MTEPTITIYRIVACPYCERVVRCLQDLEVPYRSVFVEAMHSVRDAAEETTENVDDRVTA